MGKNCFKSLNYLGNKINAISKEIYQAEEDLKGFKFKIKQINSEKRFKNIYEFCLLIFGMQILKILLYFLKKTREKKCAEYRVLMSDMETKKA